MKNTIRFIDLFAGIGGMRLGFESIGARCVFTSEWNEYSQKTYRANFPETEAIAGDITRVDAASVPDHNLLLAGFPCQPFSVAGVSKKNSLGRAHGFLDATQGTLFFDVARIIATKRPEAFLLENVRNLVSHDQGRTFRVIRETLEKLGYEIHCRILDARACVPQHRERIFIAGFRRTTGFQWSELPAATHTLSEILHAEPVPDKYVLSDKLWNYLQAYAAKHRAKGNGFGCSVFGPGDTARTLSARYHKDGSEILIDRGEGRNPRRLTPRECARLMGYPDSFRIPVSDTRAYQQFGNSVVVPVIQHAARLMKPWILSALALASTLCAQTNPASLAAHRYRAAHESQILSEFSRLLSIPNIAGDKPNIRRNADAIATALNQRGVAAQLVEEPNANPVSMAKSGRPAPPAPSCCTPITTASRSIRKNGPLRRSSL